MTNKNSKINKLLKKRCELFAKTLEIDKQLMSLTRNIPKDEQQGKHFFLTIEITNLSKGEEFGGWDLYKYFSGGYEEIDPKLIDETILCLAKVKEIYKNRERDPELKSILENELINFGNDYLGWYRD